MASKNHYLLMLAAILTLSCQKETKTNFGQYVDPFVGTTFTGHTFPNAVYPFGFMQPGPQTGNFAWKYCGGYRYEDKQIWGFSHNRNNGTGIPDLSDLLIMPFSGEPAEDFKSSFSKDTEKASPGYYAVSLTENAVDVELTTTPHVAIHRYTFKKDNPGLYINLQSAMVDTEEQFNTRVLYADVNIEDSQTLSGHNIVRGWANPRHIFYVIKFDKPFIFKENITKDERNKAPTYVFRFDGKGGDILHVKTSISTVSIEGAKAKINAELSDWDFDKVRKSAENAWEEFLSKIKIEGTPDQKKNFYTSMYHLGIQPVDIADLDGKYRGPNDSILISPSGKYYSTFSLWDTFRAAHPLYTIIAPEQTGDFINSMLLHAENYGILPIWALWGKETYCMIGNHGVPPVVDACLKNIPGIDQEKAWQFVKQSLTGHNLKYDWKIYDQYGYFPFDLVKEESVSRTLECGFDDYCAAMLAQKLGKTEDCEFFMKRASYYKNLFDPESKLMHGKDSKGDWRYPFNKFVLSHAGTAGGDYTEGNAWQYTWHVLHDVDGLVELMGGEQYFATKLDSLFNINDREESNGFTGDVTGLIGQYAQGNEPSHHVIYLYSMVGKNDRTAELIREVFDKFYQPKPDGLCGNDDCGQMSAWYIFSAMGFYPVNPASGEYIIGAPQIPGAEIKLADNKKFTMKAENLSKENKYIKSVTLNGKPLERHVIKHSDIMNGGSLVFVMTN
ncbi:MAG: GH92 family glycosyl hydrolase [Dysgonamonadaceae bacterium]|jgi:predicted alpha-1,2-mannosidase|nr:GH92 family glycosyl hydrolase [Dysgonamonadaceae bacterium]